jgi:8-oxo-dGTP pyrophosphatase MutT (NUDIX family)
MSAVGEELVDWVDEDDRPLGVVSRARMRRERLRHRAVFVVVVDGADRVIVHRRADWKDVWPSAWDICFGGVLAAGEEWEAGARRELAEEAGVTGVALVPFGGTFRFDDERVSLVGRLWLVRTDREVVPADGEVVAVDRVPRTGLAAWAAGRTVCPDSRQVVLPLLLAPPGGVSATRRRGPRVRVPRPRP